MILSQFRSPNGSHSRVLGTILLILISSFSPATVNSQEPRDVTNSQNSPISPLTKGSGAAAPLSENSDSESNSSSSSLLSNLGRRNVPMSADQIVQILQGNPDLLVEVKNQVADYLQLQGTQLQANDISDEMLYNQISTNARVRSEISNFLEARGYAPQDGLQGAADGTLSAATRPEQSSLSASSGNPSAVESNIDGSPVDAGSIQRAHNESSARLTRRGTEETRASTDIPKVVHQPTPYNLQSLQDLYSQIPESAASLKRFGSEMFVTRNSPTMGASVSSLTTPLDVAVGPDYVLGPGDALTINLWGGLTQSFTKVVDREGQILLPEAGLVQVAGLSLQHAQDLIANSLKQQFRNAQVSVTVARLRSVRVYIVGDVQRPGGYDISSLATPLGALYAAGGPTSVGSLRTVRHLRGDRLIDEVDLYDFLIHGVQKQVAHFESGDTLQVPPAGPQVAIFGAVKRPAIYELKSGESTLASVLEDAGGVTAAASLEHITIERIAANRSRETVTLGNSGGNDLKGREVAVDRFAVHDGDRIYIAPIPPYSQHVIYLQGHVVQPGRLPYIEGMRLNDVLRSYRDMLPEPADEGEIVRLVPPDLHAETIAFNVPDVVIGNTNIPLEPFDTIRVFGRYEVDSPTVTVHGEVLRPGTYPLSRGMTVAQLVRMAGGFKRDALRDTADLTSYHVENGSYIEGKLSAVHIGSAMDGTDASADVHLKPGDILTIHQITGWNDIGESVAIQGQVKFPGNYGFQEGEHLSSVLRRAGGMRDTAYPEGAVLIRQQVRELEEKSQQELIRQIETSSAAVRLGPAVATSDTGGTLQLIKAQQEQALAQLKSHPATGRMVIHITADIDNWANTPADPELRRGDVITIPKRPGFVLVSGQVYNATALTFVPGKTAAWYLKRAGGTNGTANRKEIFIIRANGTVVGRHSGGWFDAQVLSTKLDPGDVVVVPQKVIGASLLWRNLLTTAQLVSSIAITAGIAAAAL